MILGMASVANAALVLSFNGDTGEGDAQTEFKTVNPSDIFVVDVWSTTDAPDEFWVGIAGPVSYTGLGTVYSPPAPSTMVLSDGGYGPGSGWVYAYMTDPVMAGIGTWWEIELHCEGEGDVIIDLYDALGGTIIDTLVVHQIPEPATVGLLSFGGLFFRKRKK